MGSGQAYVPPMIIKTSLPRPTTSEPRRDGYRAVYCCVQVIFNRAPMELRPTNVQSTR